MVLFYYRWEFDNMARKKKEELKAELNSRKNGEETVFSEEIVKSIVGKILNFNATKFIILKLRLSCSDFPNN